MGDSFPEPEISSGKLTGTGSQATHIHYFWMAQIMNGFVLTQMALISFAHQFFTIARTSISLFVTQILYTILNYPFMVMNILIYIPCFLFLCAFVPTNIVNKHSKGQYNRSTVCYCEHKQITLLHSFDSILCMYLYYMTIPNILHHIKDK